MSAAFATAALPNRPDPVPDPAAGSMREQSRTGRLLGLLRKLIEYGLELACALQQSPAAATLLTVALYFGTRDIALILARITRGLELAGALEAKLVRRPLPEVIVQDFFACRLTARRAPADRRRRAPSFPTCRQPRTSPPRCVTAPRARSSPRFATISASCRSIRCGARS